MRGPSHAAAAAPQEDATPAGESWRAVSAPRGGPHLPEQEVPARAFAISSLALIVAGGTNLAWPDAVAGLTGLLWLLAVVPAFLLAYYRGWRGATVALGVAMLLVVLVEVGGSLWGERPVRWGLVGVVVTVLITVSLGAGFITHRLQQRASQALQLAYADPLTGLPNRRVLELFFDRQFAAARRGQPLSVVVFDIDGFKGYNDELGHTAGDDAIRAVARILEANTRSMNVSGRFGGDEFLTLLPGETPEGALRFAERIRRGVAAIRDLHDRPLSVSGGVASFSHRMTEPRALLNAADRALYSAKRAGGDLIRADEVPEGKDAVVEGLT